MIMCAHIDVPRSERDFQSKAVLDVGDTFAQCGCNYCKMIQSEHGKPIPRIYEEGYVIVKMAFGAAAAKVSKIPQNAP